MAERRRRSALFPRAGAALPLRRAGWFVLVALGLALALPSGVSARLLVGPVLPPDAGREAAHSLEALARQADREALVERWARLQRDQEVQVAALRAAELRLRRMAVDFAALAAERATVEAQKAARDAEVTSRQRRLEALLAEIVQLSRDETGDPRRLAQLRAVAAALAEPFAEARRALEQSRAAVVALERREEGLLRSTGAARRDLAAAAARHSWLAKALDETLTVATEAAGRVAAARRMATLTATRVARGAATRQLAGLAPPAALAGVGGGPGQPTVRRLRPPDLTARATVVERPIRAVAHFALRPEAALARSPAGAQLMPVAGEVISRFGEGLRAPFDRGLTIEVKERRLVRAPRDGRVVFARAYDGFGLLLIIDHGNEYHSLLSGLSRFVVHEGWAVRAGQMVGTIEPGSEAVGRLYVELRRRGVPVDPLAWFAAGQDKVRS